MGRHLAGAGGIAASPGLARSGLRGDRRAPSRACGRVHVSIKSGSRRQSALGGRTVRIAHDRTPREQRFALPDDDHELGPVLPRAASGTRDKGAPRTMSIEALLQAAAYLDRSDEQRTAGRAAFVRGRSADRDGESPPLPPESEHGYATTMPMPRDGASSRTAPKRPKARKNSVGRSNHNELEKNRRAHLKNCLDTLKDMVPLGPEASRHTTYGLLTKAKKFIKNLEERERRNNACKEELNRQQRYLKQRLEQLQQFRSVCKRRSVSECSSSTVSSSHSTASHSSIPSPVSESDEVDVIGYGSTQSDTDDYSSIRSTSSDSGMSISTTLLRFSEMEAL